MKTTTLARNGVSTQMVDLIGRLVELIAWPARRRAMGDVTIVLPDGKRRVAENVFGWNRRAIEVGIHEYQTGIACVNDISSRVKPKTEEQKVTEEADRVKHKTISLGEATCQLAAEKQAHDPKSIEWLREERRFRFDNKRETKATSSQPMRAKNAMGALVRTGIVCKLILAGDGWRVVKLSVMK